MSEPNAGPIHDLGCQCWPHVSEDDALNAIAGAAVAEYRETKRQVAEARRAALDEAIAAVERLYADSDVDEGEAWDDGVLCLSKAAVIDALTRLRDGA